MEQTVEPPNSSYSSSATSIPVATYGSNTTPTLTPTTLANIEQSFVELTTVPVTSQSGVLPNQAGFVPPVIDSSTTSSDMSLDSFRSEEDIRWSLSTPIMSTCSSQNQTTNPTTTTSVAEVVVTAPRRTGGRRVKQQNLTPEEQERRQLRRERNKLAAAKCRKRRLDRTNTLLSETEVLEEEKQKIENEITQLQCQKEQLECILSSHLPMCKKKISTSAQNALLSTNREAVQEAPPVVMQPTSMNVTPILGVSNASSLSMSTAPSGTIYHFTEEQFEQATLPLLIKQGAQLGLPLDTMSQTEAVDLKMDPRS